MKNKLKASVRTNKRYLLIESDKDTIEKIILDYIGILGWSKAEPLFVSTNGSRTILSVSRKSLNDVKAAFEISKDSVRILKVSGTLKGLGEIDI